MNPSTLPDGSPAQDEIPTQNNPLPEAFSIAPTLKLNERVGMVKAEHPSDPSGLFDDLEELAAESSRTTDAQSVESLDDLDTLLAESVAVSNAKKAQRQGKKLTAEQIETLEAVQIAAEVAQWEPQAMYFHLCEVYCNCGSRSLEYRGRYMFQHRVNGNGRRLLRIGQKEGRAWEGRKFTFFSTATTDECANCFDIADGVEGFASSKDCDLLKSLTCESSHPKGCDHRPISSMMDRVGDEAPSTAPEVDLTTLGGFDGE